ncbi:MAG: HEAT repeat domain-containing protein, partial [Gemmatimonadetes bacterium]|nr:HEAT repeat domain-containing protein [Gemmatimonadota bacterium]
VLGALLDSLEDTGPREQDEVLSILQALFPHFLGHGELRLAGELLDQLTEIAAREGVLAQPASQKLGVLLNELSTPSAIEELMRALETGALEPSADELAGFLRHLREGALGPLIRAANGLQHPEIRSVVEASVETMAGRYRAALIEQLRSRDPVVAAGAARLVGRLGFAEAARELAALMSRPEAAVRLAAVETAVSLRSAEAVRVLLDGLRDAERQVRVSAARGLGALRHQPAAEPLRAMIEGKDLHGADLTEKLAIFEAYGALNTPDSVTVLDRILNGRGFLGRREPPEMRACAAVGLARSTLPTAKQALQKAEGDDDPVVRTAVARVLRGVSS